MVASPTTGSPRRSVSGSPRRQVMAVGTVALQLQQFLDDWHYQIMSTSMGKTWTRREALLMAFEVLALNGCQITQQDIEWFCNQHEETVLPILAERIPLEMRENLEELTQQLKFLLTTIGNVRRALDKDDPDLVASVMEEVDHGCIKDQILKNVVVKASQDVEQILRCQDSWVKCTEKRLARLGQAGNNAQGAQQKLRKLESLIERHNVAGKANVTKALHGFCESLERTAAQASFTQWACITTKSKDERQLRKEFREKLELKNVGLLKMQLKAASSIRHHIELAFAQGLTSVIGVAFTTWQKEVADQKRARVEAGTLLKFQAKFADAKEGQKRKVYQVMLRMSSDVDVMLLGFVMECWRKGTAGQRDQLRSEKNAVENQALIKEHAQRRKQISEKMLVLLHEDVANGLIELAVQAWTRYTVEEKAARKEEETLKTAEEKHNSLRSRRKNLANLFQNRVADQLKANAMLRCLKAWERESKCNRMERYYKDKMDSKRKQLQTIHSLFRKFADKLDEGLGADNASDSSGRIAPSRRKLSKGEHSLSLPDISSRPT